MAIPRIVNFDPAGRLGSAARRASGTVFVTDPDRVEWVVAYAPVPQTGWGLIIAEPWEHVGNPLLSTSLLTPLVLDPCCPDRRDRGDLRGAAGDSPAAAIGAQAARAGQGDYAALEQPISGIGEIQTLHDTLAQMADQLRSYQRSLQSYAADVLRGQEDERSRLAHELHDETVQALIALDQRLQLIERTARRDPQAALSKVRRIAHVDGHHHRRCAPRDPRFASDLSGRSGTGAGHRDADAVTATSPIGWRPPARSKARCAASRRNMNWPCIASCRKR